MIVITQRKLYSILFCNLQNKFVTIINELEKQNFLRVKRIFNSDSHAEESFAKIRHFEKKIFDQIYDKYASVNILRLRTDRYTEFKRYLIFLFLK